MVGCCDGMADGFDDGKDDGSEDGTCDGCPDGTSVSQRPHVPGQWYITSSIVHRNHVSLYVAQTHFFHGDLKNDADVISNSCVEEKSSQQ